MPADLDDDTLASLTEEEIAALNDEDDTTTSADGDEGDPADAKDPKSPLATDADEEDGDAEEDDPDTDPLAGDSDPDDKEPDPKPAAADAAADPVWPKAPVPTFAKADEDRLKAIEQERKAIIEAADEGDESFATAAEKVSALAKEAAKLESKRDRDAEAAEAFKTQGEEVWNTACEAWFKEQGIDVSKMPAEQVEAFDKVVMAITGGDLGAGLTPKQQLDEALAIYQRRPGSAKWPGKGVTPAKPGRRTRDVMIPPNPGDMGAAEEGGVEDGRYALLDRLADTNPLKFEAKLEQMTEAQRDAYMASR